MTIMIKKEYIEVKRLYFPPKVIVHHILNEGLMEYVSGEASAGGYGDGDEEGGNVKAKQFFYIENDEVLE